MKINAYRSCCGARGRVLVILFALAAFACIAGCGEKKARMKKTTREGGVLYFGMEVAFHGFDVLGGSGFLNPPMAPLNNLILEPLFRMDVDGSLIPILGLSAAPSEDGKSWDVALRQGVVFHDGAPFNADAVVHHWRRILDPKNKYGGRPIFQPVLDVEKVDDFTVRFILDHPWPALLNVLSDELYMFAFIPSPKAVNAGVHARKPVGTGPFKFSKWNFGDHFVVLKNMNYWRKGKPLLNKVVFRTIPDSHARWASLLAGQLDLIALDNGPLIEKAKKNDDLFTFHTRGNGAEIIMINTRKPPLDDIRVRRALAMANNQEMHIKLVYGNTIPLVHHPFGERFTCEDDGYMEYNPGRAKQLIAEYGKPVEIECLHSNTSRGRRIGELLQQLYKKIGVTLTPTPITAGPHIRKVMKGEYHLATWRIPPSSDHGPQLLRGFHSQSPTNFTGYGNPGLDEMLEAQRREMNPVKRSEIWCNIVRMHNRDVPFIYRGGRRFHMVARKKIRDVMDTPGIMIDLATAWLDEDIKFNMAAFEIEKNASGPSYDCPDPGDVEAVKAILLGAWKGTDSWGGSLQLSFKEDGKIVGSRSGGYDLAAKYLICGTKIVWRTKSGTQIILTLSGDKMEGRFERGSYSGEISLERDGA
ncbi:MAG: hypothetical protein GY859_08060 [Desulfobacterales bacterium]|nr:hypothetical protein [Desulfobacterales bacterium]